MDWQIKTISQKSSLTGNPFEPGDVAVSLIYKDAKAKEIGRADVHESELGEFALEGELLGRWRRVIRGPDEEAANASETLASAEDFFFSLYEGEEESKTEEREMLKHLLGLMLERKRVLRAVGPRQTKGEQTYLHVKTKQEVGVPILDMSHELMLQVQDTIGELIL